MKKTLTFLSLLLMMHCLAAQNNANPVLSPEKIITPVKIDGRLTEDVWQQARAASGFQANFPADSAQARGQR